MTNQEINERIAKLCGWVSDIDKEDHVEFWHSPDKSEKCYTPPDYAESLDACREFECSMNWTEKVVYADHLVDLCGDDSYDPIFATAMKRCESFLRLKGQWE